MTEPRAHMQMRREPARLLLATLAWSAATVVWFPSASLLPEHQGAGTSVRGWVNGAPVDVIAVYALWLLALVALVLLAAGHLLGVLALTGRSVRALHLADRLTVGLVGRVCAGTATVGVGLLGASAGAQTAPAAPDSGPRPPELRLVDEPPVADGPAPLLRLLEPIEAAVAHADVVPEPAGHDAVSGATGSSVVGGATAMAPAPHGAALDVWIVRPGDNLWDIAEAVLRPSPGVDADLDVVHTYWQRLIAANHANLADPANPDLLFSGQHITLPPR